MSLEKHRQIEAIFQTALGLDESAREEFLDAHCTDESIREEVEKLLTGGERTGETAEDRELDSMAGRKIGAYRLIKEIGRGGMGAVYLAERADSEFSKKVAVKLIKRGMDTDLVVRRFRNERQILATLNHPFITRLIDGGTSREGLPYFVMEYVEGEPLYKYCKKQNAALAERLKIFRQICEAVAEAHRHKIIHRDLKPSNILVKTDGTPKLLDFGIAKLLDPEIGAVTMEPTATHLRMMTPRYASPEQISGEPVSPASDVYSLGVLLYELVTGRSPYQTKSRSPYQIAQAVLDEEPVSPSEAVKEKKESSEFEPGEDQSTKIEDRISENLERIILKSLRKKTSERYPSAAELAADIENYLEDQPVKAEAFDRRENLTERINKNSVAILPFKIFGEKSGEETGDDYLSIGLADALVTRLSSVQRLVVRPTSSVLRFNGTTDAFEAGKQLGVEYVVDGNIRHSGKRIRVSVQLLNIKENASSWAENFDERFTDVLELEDSISANVAESLIPKLTGEERRRLEKRGTNNAQAYEFYLRGRFHWNQFTPEALLKAGDAFQKAIEIDPDYALAHVGICDFYIWANIYGLIPSAEAIALAEKAARRAIRLDDKLGEAYASLGLTHQNRFGWEKAEKFYRKALELAPNYVHAHEWWAAQLVGHGDFDEGVREIRIGEKYDPFSLRTKTLVAWTLYQARRYEEALEVGRQLVDLDKNYPQGYAQLGNNQLQLGQIDEAVENFKKFDAMIPNLGLAKYVLCHALAAAGRESEARAVLEEIKSLASEGYVKPYFLGMAHAALNERDAAFANFEEAFGENDPWLLWFGTEPMLDRLRDDARMDALLRRMNLPILKRGQSKKELLPAAKVGKTSAEFEDVKKSIAVLPLKFIGEPENDDEFLAVGLADALITRFSNVRRLTVRPTSSVLAFGELDTNPFEAGKTLGVDYVLDGSIRRVGDRLRVTTQLLNVAENVSLWAEKFDEEYTEILAAEDSISEGVIKSLLSFLSGEEREGLKKRGTNNAEAHEAYLRGRSCWHAFTEEGFAKALKYYQRAIELAPDYALAYSGIADYYNFLGIYAVLPFAETSAKAKKAALKAIEFDPNLAEGYAALGFAVIMHDFDWEESGRHLRRALELNPNYVTGQVWYCYYLGLRGEFNEALRQIEDALKIDRGTPIVPQTLNWVLYYARHFDEAIETTRRFIRNEPRYGLTFVFFGSMLWRVGRFEEALEMCLRAVDLLGRTPYSLVWLASAYAAAGKKEETADLLAEIRELGKSRYVSPYLVGMIYANAGDREKAFAQLEKALEIRDARVLWLSVDPQFDSLRDDERFKNLLLRINQSASVQKKNERDGAPKKIKEKTDVSVKSIAVLPLKFIGRPEADDEFLAIGLADAMITRLSKVRRMVVRPTSSVLRFGNWEDPFAAGRELGVDFILCGTIRRAGERIRISAQLLDIKNDATLWADKFNEKFTDVLELEDLVAERTAKLLIPKLTGEEQKKLAKRSTDNPQAFEAYLRGRYHLNIFTPAAFARAKDYFEKAIRLDSDYALAYVGLADYYFALGTFSPVPPLECYGKAQEMARRALTIDDSLGDAYAVLGFTYFADLNFERVEKTLRHSIELNPNYSLSRVWLSVLLTFYGKYDEALAEAKRAAELSPLSGFDQQHYAWILYQAGHFDEAVARTRRILENEPNFSHSLGVLAWILRHLGQVEESIEKAERSVDLSGGNPWLVCSLAASYAKAGQIEKTRETLRDIKKSAAEIYVSPFCLALAYCTLGDIDSAFTELEKALETRDVWLIWIASDPQVEALRADPRYEDLMRRMKKNLIK